VAVKWCLEVMRPFPAFITIETIATCAFFALAMSRGEPGAIARVPGSVVWMVVGTGVGCIALAHIFYTGAVERLGVVVCNTVILGSPIVTAIFSRIFFHERLTVLQIVSGAILLGGAAAAVHARARLRARLAAVPPQ
jgi:drug/metabolite transporter (DMT)-like permease